MSTYYGRSDVLAEGANADVDTAEEDVVSVTTTGATPDSQLSIYIDHDLGTHTSMKVRYYYQNEASGLWYQVPLKTAATGILSDTPTVLDSSSPAKLVEDVPFSACFGFKVTAQGVGGANGSITAKILTRNN